MTDRVIEEFGVGTFNIQNLRDLSRHQVRKCASIIGAHAGLCGMQEIAESEDDDDVESQLDPADWYHFHRPGENKISVKRSRWQPCPKRRLPEGFRKQQRIRLHGGMAKVSPHRELVDVCLTWRARPTWTPFLFGDTHLVSGADTNKPEQRFRDTARATSFDLLVAWALRGYEAGVNVILVGDMNWRKMPKLHPKWVWVVDDGIDKIGYLNAPGSNWRMRGLTTERWPNPSDHDYRVANMRAVEKAAPPEPPDVCPTCGQPLPVAA